MKIWPNIYIILDCAKIVFAIFSDHTTFVNAEQLVGIKILNLSTPVQVTPGSNLELQIEIHSRFPQEIPMDEMMVSLTFSEPITSNPMQEDTSSPEKRSLVTKNKRIAGRHSRPSRYVNGGSTYISKVYMCLIWGLVQIYSW